MLPAAVTLLSTGVSGAVGAGSQAGWWCGVLPTERLRGSSVSTSGAVSLPVIAAGGAMAAGEAVLSWTAG